MSDPIFRAYVGPDFMYEDGYHAVLQFLPMRSLMTKRSDEGRMILVGLEVEVGVRRSYLHRVKHGLGPWRPYLRLRSDATEIAERRATPPLAPAIKLHTTH